MKPEYHQIGKSKIDLSLGRQSFMCSGKDVPGAWPPPRDTTNLDRTIWYTIILPG